MPLWNPFLIYKCLQWPWSDTHGCNRVAGMVQQPARLFKAPLSLSLRLCCYGNRHPGEHTGETSSISRVSVCKHLPQATHKTDWETARGHGGGKRVIMPSCMAGFTREWFVCRQQWTGNSLMSLSLTCTQTHIHTNDRLCEWSGIKWNLTTDRASH